jgi:hypothetical protein
MEHITKELEHATGNKRGALRQTRRIYSSFVRGDDVLQDPEDEEEEQAMGVPPESVADPDSSWAQINGTVARDLAVSKFETFGNAPEELQARMETVVGGVLRRVLVLALTLWVRQTC